MIYVTDSVDQAERDLRDIDLGAAKVTTGQLSQYIKQGGTRGDLTMEYMIERSLFFCGDPDTVYNEAFTKRRWFWCVIATHGVGLGQPALHPSLHARDRSASSEIEPG